MTNEFLATSHAVHGLCVLVGGLVHVVVDLVGVVVAIVDAFFLRGRGVDLDGSQFDCF